jgi:hypothetical protein
MWMYLENTVLILKSQARHQWLTPIILATQEAEIRRLAVQNQPQAKEFSRLYRNKKTHHTHKKKGWWSGSRCRP